MLLGQTDDISGQPPFIDNHRVAWPASRSNTTSRCTAPSWRSTASRRWPWRINDSFNATPLSVRASLELLASLTREESGRRIAVLGDIAHLGPSSDEIHASLARDVVERGIDQVFTFGPHQRKLHEVLPSSVAAGHYSERAALAGAIVESWRAGDVIAVKGSVPCRLGEVVRMLKAAAQPS